MSFGDWELFKMVVLCLREMETSAEEEHFINQNVRFGGGRLASYAGGWGEDHPHPSSTPLSSLPSDAGSLRRGNSLSDPPVPPSSKLAAIVTEITQGITVSLANPFQFFNRILQILLMSECFSSIDLVVALSCFNLCLFFSSVVCHFFYCIFGILV